MGRIVVEARLWHYLDDLEVREGSLVPLARECLVDNGAVDTVIPRSLVAELDLMADCQRGRLVSNPEHPESPVIDLFAVAR